MDTPSSGCESGIRTLVFSDVENSTLLAERMGAADSAQLWRAHDRVARDLLAANGGREIGRSDGLLAMFATAVDATRYALGYQAALSGLGLKPRVGIHAGPVTQRPNSAHDVARGAQAWELEGPAIAVTARLMALARGGQTLLSAQVRAQLDGAMPEGAQVEAHGFYQLRGIEAPLEVFEVGIRRESPFQPPADVEKAYCVVRSGDIWLPVREVKHNLPAERDSFVGRIDELRSLAGLLADRTRLVTLVGVGGVGKTRLARRYARTWLGDWPGGVYFCDLSESRDLDAVFFAVASALGIALGRENPARHLEAVIAGRGRCLLILDNTEQIARGVAEIVDQWLDAAPEACFLATSRERLHLGGEQILPLEPLPITSDGVALFAERAAAQMPSFAMNADEREGVAEVVRLLDGLPLAIELAAARIRVLSPRQFADRLGERFNLLKDANVTTARQATLRAAIDWSWKLLSPWEQSAFAQSAVFGGGFTLEAAEAVIDLAQWPAAPPVLDVLQALVDKSLIHAAPAGDEGETFLGKYLSIDEYAKERLAAAGDETRIAAETRHGTFYAAYGTDEAIAALARRDGVVRVGKLARSRDNVIVACHRAIQRGDAACAVATFAAAWTLLEMRGPCSEGVVICERVLAMEAMPASERANALHLCGTVLRRDGQSHRAGDCFRRGLDLARQLGERRREAQLLLKLGSQRADEGLMGEGVMHLVSALDIAAEVGDRSLQGGICNMLGVLEAEQDHRETARTHFMQALDHCRAAGDRRGEAVVFANLANLARIQGTADESIEYTEQALAIAKDTGDRRTVGLATGNLGTLYLDVGRVSEAHDLFERAIEIHIEVGNRHGEGTVLGELGKAMARQGRLADARGHFDAGERLLRGVGACASVATLLCDRSEAELAVGDRLAARATLNRAEEVVRPLNPQAASSVVQRVRQLRAEFSG